MSDTETPTAPTRSRGASKGMYSDWCDLQGAIANPPKDKTAHVRTKTGGDYSYSYASLDGILTHTRDLLHKHGFGVTQDVQTESGFVGVLTMLRHISGQDMTFGPLFLPIGPDAQSAGSAITYARRYALCAALNIAAEDDDDGKTSGGRANSAASAQQPVPSRETTGPPVETDTDAPVPVTPQGAATGGVSKAACVHIVQQVSTKPNGDPLPEGMIRCPSCGWTRRDA